MDSLACYTKAIWPHLLPPSSTGPATPVMEMSSRLPQTLSSFDVQKLIKPWPLPLSYPFQQYMAILLTQLLLAITSLLLLLPPLTTPFFLTCTEAGWSLSASPCWHPPWIQSFTPSIISAGEEPRQHTSRGHNRSDKVPWPVVCKLLLGVHHISLCGILTCSCGLGQGTSGNLHPLYTPSHLSQPHTTTPSFPLHLKPLICHSMLTLLLNC